MIRSLLFCISHRQMPHRSQPPSRAHRPTAKNRSHGARCVIFTPERVRTYLRPWLGGMVCAREKETRIRHENQCFVRRTLCIASHLCNMDAWWQLTLAPPLQRSSHWPASQTRTYSPPVPPGPLVPPAPKTPVDRQACGMLSYVFYSLHWSGLTMFSASPDCPPL